MVVYAGADSCLGIQGVVRRRSAFGRLRNDAIDQEPCVVGKSLCVALTGDDGCLRSLH